MKRMSRILRNNKNTHTYTQRTTNYREGILINALLDFGYIYTKEIQLEQLQLLTTYLHLLYFRHLLILLAFTHTYYMMIVLGVLDPYNISPTLNALLVPSKVRIKSWTRDKACCDFFISDGHFLQISIFYLLCSLVNQMDYYSNQELSATPLQSGASFSLSLWTSPMQDYHSWESFTKHKISETSA